MNQQATANINAPQFNVLIPRNAAIKPPEKNRKIFFWIGLSLLVHLGVLFFSLPQFESLKTLDDQSPISVDLMMDVNPFGAKENTLPDAVKKPDAAVPANILPQLPKRFMIEDEKKDDKEIVVDKKIEEKIQKKEENPPVPLSQNDDVNKIKKDDAIKRLALEKLRLLEKKSKELTAPKIDAIAKLKEDLSKVNASVANLPGKSGGQADQYRAMLLAAIRPNWYLPPTVKFKNPDALAVISIRIESSGKLRSADVKKTSGSDVIDEYAIRAIKLSTFPEPPADLVGVELAIGLSTKSSQ